MSPDITNLSVIARSPDHIATDIAGETVVLDMKSGMYYGLEEVAALIWKVIERPSTLAEIRAAVLEEYEVDAERCDRDVLEFLRKMAGAGLIEITHGTTT